MKPNYELLLTVPEFAARLAVTPSCVRRWILLRRIACVKVGSRLVRLPESEASRLLAEGFRPRRPQ